MNNKENTKRKNKSEQERASEERERERERERILPHLMCEVSSKPIRISRACLCQAPPPLSTYLNFCHSGARKVGAVRRHCVWIRSGQCFETHDLWEPGRLAKERGTVYMHEYICIYMRVCIYVYIYICLYSYIYVYHEVCRNDVYFRLQSFSQVAKERRKKTPSLFNDVCLFWKTRIPSYHKTNIKPITIPKASRIKSSWPLRYIGWFGINCVAFFILARFSMRSPRAHVEHQREALIL